MSELTDRDILRDQIERACVIAGKTCEERDYSITVIGGPKYLFLDNGELKSIIRDGISYGPDGKKVLR